MIDPDDVARVFTLLLGELAYTLSPTAMTLSETLTGHPFVCQRGMITSAACHGRGVDSAVVELVRCTFHTFASKDHQRSRTPHGACKAHPVVTAPHLAMIALDGSAEGHEPWAFSLDVWGAWVEVLGHLKACVWADRELNAPSTRARLLQVTPRPGVIEVGGILIQLPRRGRYGR